MKDEQRKKDKSAFGMFNEAGYMMFGLAKNLRKNMTDAEMILWGHLKKGIDGLKFRRQHPLGVYIADLYCHKIKLVIEVDGNVHNITEVKEYDMSRETELKNYGYTVIRFTNDEVMKDVDSVLAEIKSTVEKLNKSSK